MKLVLFRFYCLATALLLISINPLFSQVSRQVVIKGTFENRTEAYVVVNSLLDHIVFHGDSIPVVNGKFEYVVEAYPQLPYRLVFGSERDAGRIQNKVQFFVDADTIFFTLKENAPIAQHRVKGGKLNSDYAQYLSIYEKKVLIPAMEKMESNRTIQQDTKLSETQKKDQNDRLFQELEEMSDQWMLWQFNEFIPQDQSLVSLAMQYEYFDGQMILPGASDHIQKALEGALLSFQTNPLYIQLSQLVNSKELLLVGSKIPAMTIPALKGREQPIYERIGSHKLTLINLWGTWCAPCIRKSLEINPLHQAYKEKGFGVLGIAWEYGNTTNLEKVIKRYQFDWHHFVDLNASQQVWSHWGVKAIGLMILVDKEGTILALDPSQQELQKWLEGI